METVSSLLKPWFLCRPLVKGADAKTKKLDGVYVKTGRVHSEKPVWYCVERKTHIFFYRRWIIAKSTSLKDFVKTMKEYAYSTHDNSESTNSPINLIYKVRIKDEAEISKSFSVEKNWGNRSDSWQINFLKRYFYFAYFCECLY